MAAACNSSPGFERCFIGATPHFLLQKLSQLSVPLSGIVDRPPHTSCLQMRQQKLEVPFFPRCIEAFWSKLVSATIGSCSFHLTNSAFPTGSTFLSRCWPFLVQLFLRGHLMWILNGANSPIGSKTQNTIDWTFLWVMSVSSSLVVPLQLETIFSNRPLYSSRHLQVWFNIYLFRAVNWFQVCRDCFGNLVTVAYPLFQFKFVLQKKMP